MFRTLSQFFGSLTEKSTSGKRAQRSLNKALLFGGLLLVLWLGAEYLLPDGTPEEPPVISDEAGTVATTSPSEEPAGSWNPGLVVAVMLLGGGIALAVYLRRDESGSAPATSPALRIIARHTIGQEHRLLLVECGGEVHLMGTGSGEIRLLKSYDTDEFPELYPEEGPPVGDGAAQPAALVGSSGPGLGTSLPEVLREYASQYSAGTRT
jgi:flagellar biogenesis protein FliO